MTKTELEKNLLQFTGGKPWISKRRLKVWYGRGQDKLDRFVENLDYRQEGNRIEYFVTDVAKAILDECVKA